MPSCGRCFHRCCLTPTRDRTQHRHIILQQQPDSHTGDSIPTAHRHQHRHSAALDLGRYTFYTEGTTTNCPHIPTLDTVERQHDTMYLLDAHEMGVRNGPGPSAFVRGSLLSWGLGRYSQFWIGRLGCGIEFRGDYKIYMLIRCKYYVMLTMVPPTPYPVAMVGFGMSHSTI